MFSARILPVVVSALCLGMPAQATESGKIVGAINVNAQLSPYEEASASADQYPKSFRRESTPLYVPVEILQATIEKIKNLTLPAGQKRKTSQDALAAQTVSRFLLRGAVVIDKIRTKYRDSAQRSHDLDMVFEPEKPFTQNRTIEGARAEKFLKTIYPGLDATSEEKARAMRVVSLATIVWPVPSEYSDESEPYQEAYRVFRYLMLNHLDPVFDLKLRNTGDKAVSITRATFDVEASEYLRDYNIQGLTLPETTTIVLEKGKSASAAVGATIAPGEETTMRIALRSSGTYLFFGAISLHSSGGVVYRTRSFSIAFLT